MAARWEYKVAELAEAATLVQLLEDEGEEGWELVTGVQFAADDVGRSYLVFRREPANPTWGQQKD